MAKPDHDLPGRPDRPGRPESPDQGLPGKPVPPGSPVRPGTRPDQDLPEAPVAEPKGGRKPARSGEQDVASAPDPVLGMLLPASAAIGDPSFVLRVIGAGFDATSVIVFAGQDEETTFVSDTEVTTGVNMDVWLGEDPAISVLVRTSGKDSNPLTFAFLPARVVPLDPAHASIPVPVIEQIVMHEPPPVDDDLLDQADPTRRGAKQRATAREARERAAAAAADKTPALTLADDDAAHHDTAVDIH